MRHFRATRGKTGIKHASTLVDNTGQGVATIFGHVIYDTALGRVASGASQTLKTEITTESRCEVSDIIKYVNICLECCPRGATPAEASDNCAWLEWAVVWQRERETSPTVANLGVATLGVVASHMYRENCLLTGCFPIGTLQAMSCDIKIKIPQRCTKVKLGDSLTCLCFVRTSDSTDTRTDSHRLIASSMFKAYS